MFLPPEAFGQGMSLDEGDQPDALAHASAWDVATRYHEFKAKPAYANVARELRRISVEAILERARVILGSVVRPVEGRLAPLSEIEPDALQMEMDVDETFEASPLALLGRTRPVDELALTADDIWMSYQIKRRQAVILTVDTSLSMTGEKLALTAVALAVVLLQFPDDPIGIVAFENEAKVIKRTDESLSLQELIERFIDVPAQGYTHLEAGLKSALSLVLTREARRTYRRPSTVLLTDGKYTAGRDPAYLAPRFPHLVVLKMGREKASLDLCRELAHRGNGRLREVPDLETLPSVMYGVVKDLLRGRSS